MVPPAHLLTSALIEQAAAHLGLYCGHSGRIQSGRGMKHHPWRPVRGVGRLEYPIEDAAVKVESGTASTGPRGLTPTREERRNAPGCPD